jgi:hypothetical protein
MSVVYYNVPRGKTNQTCTYMSRRRRDVILSVVVTYARLTADEIVCSSLAGMHKKSVEAAEKFNDDDDSGPEGETRDQRDKDELRSESIAILRAKAQEHSAKLVHDAPETHADQDSLRRKCDLYKSRFEEPRRNTGLVLGEEINVSEVESP